jgi:hypothetical protein
MSGYVDFCAPLNAFCVPVEQPGAAQNDHVRVPLATAGTASVAWNQSNGYTGDNSAINLVDCTLSNWLYQPFIITDSQFNQLTPQALENQGRLLGQRLAADTISASFAAVITAGNFPSSASYTSTGFTSSLALADIANKANVAKWSPNERYLIAGPTLVQSLMNNSTLNSALNFGNGNFIQNGELSKVVGFNTYQTSLTLPNSDTGFIVNPNAMAIASTYLAPQVESSAIMDAEKLTDKATGLTIGYVKFYDPYKRQVVRVIESLSGVAAGNSTGLYHIK